MTRAEVLMGQNKANEAIPLLQGVIRDNNDRQIKALAHNTLGECFYKANRYQEALWEFLWVDAVFNQDKQQQAKALYFLWRTFEQLNNAERAQECREALLNDRQFAGTEFQQRGLKEAGK
jgi:tetratricopeptide (TPR) repeat protein